ncbi:peptidoglycan DD-metalloendopeptidase family protein [Propioniciclava coleopterorum]|uniref:Peptidoglycan DD-metalloendopeptidase family protein n=1 Tax=Propioniciclava coleopterorum TaxID=2714937 RepID=A0A6G7Y436_9ACTN|nr:M23 family metallopeptidase [Propioniciclava coleopterorum]QIK71575.1 peptidoglycan DD-metalloendopeptidase family protein [Propioniciclava coleopterorum]
MAAAVTGGLLVGLVPPAMADPLSDRHREIQQTIAAARATVDEETATLQAANDALEASQRQLDDARAKLEQTRVELQAARDDDAVLATRLAAEQATLEKARAEVARARSEVETQRALTARAARDAYQSRSDVSGLIGVLEARSLGEVQQRLQWDTTIFGSTTARLTKLQALEAELEAAEKAQAAIEAKVAADKRASAANVTRIAGLEASAAQQEADVAALVERNAQYQAQAQQALQEDMDRYNALVAEESAIEADLALRVAEALARGGGRDDLGRLVAAGTISTNHATYPLVAGGAQVALSPQGFIRPVNAKPGSPFGRRFHPILKYWRNHNGTDFGAACGVPLYAAQSGTVATAGRQGGFGNYVVIDHGVIGGSSIMTGYAHQSRIAVKVGQRVSMGQLIGYVGTTGLSTGCHLHLQVYKNGKPVDPLTYIP